LELPNLCSLGLGEILAGIGDPGARRALSSLCRDQRSQPQRASYGRMRERSAGKDTTTGHWELAGVIQEEPFATFQRFPEELVSHIEQEAGVHFIGNCVASGTTIIAQMGEQHLQSAAPILYTSADSVLQIAAHEEIIPLARLYEICQVARRAADPYRIGRIIARPFVGSPGNFQRTSGRHDYSMLPPRTVLDALLAKGIPVLGVGKISDIFAGRGITRSFPTASNQGGMETIDKLWLTQTDGFIFANLVDFDSVFGHRRDVAGYANALRELDAWLGGFLPRIMPNDLVIITADHGNDPTFRGTDHTREQVPLFVLHNEEKRDLGTRETFADVAATLAEYFAVSWPTGTSFLTH
jgi:phosphopentomutase